MTRRDLIALLGGTAVSWPVGVRAQQLQRMRRIGVLSAGPVEPTSPSMTVLPNALRQLGWTEGKCGSWDGPKGKTSRSNVGTRTIELSACLNSQRNSSSLTSMSFSESAVLPHSRPSKLRQQYRLSWGQLATMGCTAVDRYC